MAENNKKDIGIFNGLVNTFKKGKPKEFVANTPKGFVSSMPPTASDPFASIEDRQQQFLDWQVEKIAHDLYNRTIFYETDRIVCYNDFRSMDQSPEISTALNVMRDECLTRSERGNILEIYSENSRIKQILNDLFKNRLNVEYNLRLWIRELCKYGDFFLHLHLDRKLGVYNTMALPIDEIHREEGVDGDPGKIRFRWDSKNQFFDDPQIAHFRLIEDYRRLPYGRSILDSARKIWKQLQLSEDAMLVYRVTRAPERRIFYIEVGNLDEDNIAQHIQKMKMRLKKQPLVDQKTGNINYKYNPMNIEEDFFIPIRGDKASKIDTLPGAQNLDQIADIEYLQNKLFASIQVPKPYLNYTEAMGAGNLLAQSDLRFARTINTIQEAVLMELRKIANVHLYLLGFHDDIDNFTLSLTNPSTQQDLLKLEHWKTKLDVFKEIFSSDATSPVSYTWAMQNILGFSQSDIKLILKQKKVEKKIFAEIEAAPETYKNIGLFTSLDKKFNKPGAENIDIKPEEGGGDLGGGGSGVGGGFGGASDLGGLGGDLGGDLEGGEDAAAGGDGDLGGGADMGDLGPMDLDTTDDAAESTEDNEEEPIAERTNRVIRTLMKESHGRFSDYMDELFQEEVVETTLTPDEQSGLLRNNEETSDYAKRIFENFEQKISNLETFKGDSKLMLESGEINEVFNNIDSDLLENNNKLNFHTFNLLKSMNEKFKVDESEDISKSDNVDGDGLL